MTTIGNLSTTGIGSLPHHNIDAALAFSFQTSLPFLPQIPIRNPWEFMIAQALEGVPGLEVEPGGSVLLDLDVWTGRSHALNERLLSAFASATRSDAFESFEPSSACSSSWQPFLFELEEKQIRLAKIQLAGPLTAQWSLRLKDGTSTDSHPEIATQIYRLVLARAIAMSRRLQAGGVQPVLYLDEPGLYGLNITNPRHLMGLQELKLLIQALKKEKVWIGVHCCSNTDWSAILGLGLDILSLDTALSLQSLLSEREAVHKFVKSGGRFSLGVIETTKTSEALRGFQPSSLLAHLTSTLEAGLASHYPELAQKILREAIFTPACGLALHSVTDAESILGALLEFHKYCAHTILPS